MTDYYQVIAGGIADLKTNSPKSRHEFYWLARTELEVQLCSVDPRLTQSEIVRERMALNEAIRKIEGEHELLLGTQRLDAARAKALVSPDPETTVVSDFDQIDQQVKSPPKGDDTTMPVKEGTLRVAGLSPCPEVLVAPLRPRRQLGEATPVGRTGRSARALMAAFLGVFGFVALPLTLYWQADRITPLFVRSMAIVQTQQFDQLWSKASYLIGQLGYLRFSASGQAKSSQEFTAVPQRAVLFEEDPAGAQTKRYDGSVVWRTEAVSSLGPGQASELAVKAELEIPDRRIGMTFSVYRNTDKSLPASHVIEIMFKLPPDFPLGGISNVPSILMKSAEQSPAVPLAGLTAKVISGFFLFGASEAKNDMQRNMELLKERAWFDIPIVYNNGRRAVLAVQKGEPGKRAFKEAFVAWVK
jgi:hypothetical protein